MKKIFLTLFIFILIYGAVAESGYNGNRWYKSRNEISLHENADPYFSDAYLNRDVRAEQIIMFGVDIVVYYHLTCGMFTSVSFTIPEDKIQEFKKQTQNKVDENTAVSFTPYDMIAYINSLGKNSSGAFYDYYSNKYFADACYNVKGPENLYKENGAGRITKYNYNEDTWLYLLENVVMGSNYVVYVTK